MQDILLRDSKALPEFWRNKYEVCHWCLSSRVSTWSSDMPLLCGGILSHVRLCQRRTLCWSR
jgi:hypothetical protein